MRKKIPRSPLLQKLRPTADQKAEMARKSNGRPRHHGKDDGRHIFHQNDGGNSDSHGADAERNVQFLL